MQYTVAHTQNSIGYIAIKINSGSCCNLFSIVRRGTTGVVCTPHRLYSSTPHNRATLAQHQPSSSILNSSREAGKAEKGDPPHTKYKTTLYTIFVISSLTPSQVLFLLPYWLSFSERRVSPGCSKIILERGVCEKSCVVHDVVPSKCQVRKKQQCTK